MVLGLSPTTKLCIRLWQNACSTLKRSFAQELTTSLFI